MATQTIDDRLQTEVSSSNFEIPQDERDRMQPWLARIAEATRDFPETSLHVHAIHHPRSGEYHVEGELKLPGRPLRSAARDAHLDTALRHCADKLARKAEDYRDRPDREALAAAEGRAALDRDVVAPEDPADGPLGEAARSGDYRAFRTGLAGYEDWLRLRAGRLVQRLPEAQARVGDELRLGDIVEEVYLDAFERFTGRPTAVRLSEWLDGLIEPAIRALLRDPEEGRTAASAARTVREPASGEGAGPTEGGR